MYRLAVLRELVENDKGLAAGNRGRGGNAAETMTVLNMAAAAPVVETGNKNRKQQQQVK